MTVVTPSGMVQMKNPIVMIVIVKPTIFFLVLKRPSSDGVGDGLTALTFLNRALYRKYEFIRTSKQLGTSEYKNAPIIL
jgi:hypothetical protein